MPAYGSTSETSNPRVGLCEALLRRALDDAALEGEAVNSAQKLVVIARRERINFESLRDHLAGGIKRMPAQPAPAEVPEACHVTMPFGKHRGRTLRDIGRRDIGYLRWVATEINDDDLRDAAGEVLDWIGGQH